MRRIVLTAVVALVVVALVAAASAFAALERSERYLGWRYGPIPGSATLTTTAPLLACTGNDENARRVIRGTYAASFTGTSMRRTRAAAGGPAGNSEPIRMRIRQSSQETVHVRTVTINDLGEQVCTLSAERCSRTGTRDYPRASNRLNLSMQGRRVRIIPSLPGAGAFNSCSGRGEPNALWSDIAFAKKFRLALFNQPTATLRFAWSGPRRRGVPGYTLTERLTYRASVGIRRLPGTPRARCRVC